MINMSDLVTKAIAQQPPDPLTLGKMMAAIEKLIERPTYPEGHPFNGVHEVKECAALKGMSTVVISGDTAYYWPDMFELKDVKVLKLPEMQLPVTRPEINFNWEFQSSPINWEL